MGKRLVKEGNQYWCPDDGCIYDLEGNLIAHDAVMRYPKDRRPDIDISDCEIIGEPDKNAQTEENPNESDAKPCNRFEYLSNGPRDFDLPHRSTGRSAGYDFHSPVEFWVEPGDTVEISLEVKCRIKPGEFLMIVPRSSLGFKGTNHIAITNTAGIIDSDYYNNNDNEGVIKARFHNFGPNVFYVQKNDRVLQGIFVKFDVTDDDDATGERIGGLGSTGK